MKIRELNLSLQKEIVISFFVISFSFILYIVITKLLKKIFFMKISLVNSKRSKTIFTLTKSIIKYLIIIFDIVIVLAIFNFNTSGLVTSLGIAGILIGLAVQDTVKDFLSGIFILYEDQYRVGDWVEISGFNGEVIGLELKTTKIKSYTGEIKIISNRTITEVINFSKNNLLAVVDITLPFEIELNVVENAIKEIIPSLEESIPNLKGKINYLGVRSFSRDGFELRLTVLAKSLKHWEVERLIRRRIKEQLEKKKIIIPNRFKVK